VALPADSEKVRLREALLYRREGKECVCALCPRECRIGEGGRGFCKVRENRGGRLFVRNYGAITAAEPRPIEIKPFFHFYPNSTAFTYSGYSCNLRCPWCQNWTLSMQEAEYMFMTPSSLIKEAKRTGCKGVCASFNEPTIMLEFNIEVFELAKAEGLYTCIVTNGYMHKEALKLLVEAGLDGARVDIKGDERVYKRFCNGADVWRVWETAAAAKWMGVHVEMINLLIPTVNDSAESVKELVRNHINFVGAETPIHFTRYFPAYDFLLPPTPVRTLEQAQKIAKEEGVLFAYIGNVPLHPLENTYCPKCNTLLILRTSYRVKEYRVVDGRCPECKEPIPLRV
jgi:pyruvate formate lyase activating enzyme